MQGKLKYPEWVPSAVSLPLGRWWFTQHCRDVHGRPLVSRRGCDSHEVLVPDLA